MTNRLLLGGGITAALLLAFILGSFSLGLASAEPSSPTTSSQATVDNGANIKENIPAYTGSIQVPDDQAKNDQGEQKNGQGDLAETSALDGLAKITADAAKQSALTAFPGATVSKVELDNENGYLVYGVRLTDSSGKSQEVKVDAGTGKVLASEADGSNED